MKRHPNLGEAFIRSVNAAHRLETLCQPTVTDRCLHPTHARVTPVAETRRQRGLEPAQEPSGQRMR